MIGPAILLVLAQQAPGGPAPYWQQRLEYDITASLDEERTTLGGKQAVRYQNNSPDTLRSVSFHLYLNAFRPGSRWAAADQAEGRKRFQELKDPAYGYNRVENATVDGQRLEPVYPFAPDSTIVRYALPRAVAPGGSFTISLDWVARLSTTFRRQGRRGRHYDFAHWFPRVVAYDKFGWAEHPLYPAGEFYGDFGDFRVTLDLPEAQVVGATGVPTCGDPGWERANRNRERPVDLGRNAYGTPSCGDVGTPEPGRKRVRFLAKDVHNFVMSMDPEYRYEGGRSGNVLVHVLYRPGDEALWGGGVAVQRTEKALAWLDGFFGPFPWPQLTNIHRLDTGSTEFPMMVHNSNAGQGLIVHEAGHNYLMGILANNEWREGWMDEGFTSFQTRLFAQTFNEAGANAVPDTQVVLLDVDGWSQPVSLVSEHYRDMSTYSAMIYNRGERFFHQLRTIVGDSTLRKIMRTYYDRWKLKHVDEAAFRAVAEEVSRQDLSTLFGQWLHGAVLYDYSVGKVKAERRKDGRAEGWITRVEVVRNQAGIYPVWVRVRSGNDTAWARATGIPEREWVEVATNEKPREVVLDPNVESHDWNMLNNRKTRGLLGFKNAQRTELFFDKFFWSRTRRDRLTIGAMPTLWYNEESGVAVGFRLRTDYLNRFEQNRLLVSVDTKRRPSEDDGFFDRVGVWARFRNPVKLLMPRTRQTLEGYSVEGRAGAAVSMEKQTNQHRTLGAQSWNGAGVRWLVTTATRYLDPALWDGGGTVEGSLWRRSEGRHGLWTTTGKLTVTGGIEYRNRGSGLTTEDSYDAQPFARLQAEATAKRSFNKVSLAVRGYAGLVESKNRLVKQRQLFVASADPYEQFSNPFLRSRGSLLAGEDVYYRMTGGGNVRGAAAGTTSTRLVALTAELERSIRVKTDTGTAQRRTRLFREVHVGLFGDAAVGNGDIPVDQTGAGFLADAGIGIRIAHRIGPTPFTTRFDFPFLVSRPRLAARGTEDIVAVRWSITVQ